MTMSERMGTRRPVYIFWFTLAGVIVGVGVGLGIDIGLARRPTMARWWGVLLIALFVLLLLYAWISPAFMPPRG